MEKKDRVRRILYRVTAALLAVCVIELSLPKKEEDKKEEGIGQLALGQVENAALSLWCPALSFAAGTQETGIWQVITSQFPILHLYGREKTINLQLESRDTYEDIIRAEGQDEYTDALTEEEMRTPETSDGRIQVDGELAKLLEEENSQALKGKEDGGDDSRDGAQMDGAASGNMSETEEELAKSGINAQGEIGSWLFSSGMAGALNSEKVEEYQWDYYRKFDPLVKEFYAVDASTVIDSSQLNLDALLGRDLSIEKRTDDQPQILVYHTHSQEDFIDSVPGDDSTTIMGVGEVLTQILREQYGYNVMHHLGKYDVENRDYAYNNSLPALEQLLEEYPSIEVVIDLHRDEVAADRKLVTQIEGQDTAMFMFFNGLSRTRKHGDIEYLPNENIADNLAFSFQMQALCNEYYPGLTRRIYLKGYRYNMHLKPRYLLIEMGAQTNTYEECYNACVPLARILDLELSGADLGD
ncbi:MAG: stage II sporulation protein P [Eubacteriales bacterium]|nr:stage II sporulation protein P [Eubacteriales bacterium]